MFKINSDGSIYVTRGDTCTISVAVRVNGEPHKFKAGDVLRIKVHERKACHCVVLQKDFAVWEETEVFDLVLTERDTRIGELINKPVDYWYEIELNPMTSPQTIIGYDDDGAKVFRLFPEAADNEVIEVPEPEEIPPVDHELDLLSPRPVENQAVTRGILEVKEEIKKGIQENAEAIQENAEKIAINAEAIQQNAEAIQQNAEKIAINDEQNAEAIQENRDLLAEHKEDKRNPHGVTKDQVGLDQVDNTSDMDKPVSTAQGEAMKGLINQMNYHFQSQENPHGVTAAQVGLGNVDNTSDIAKPVSTAQAEAIADAKQAGVDAMAAAKQAKATADSAETVANNAQNTAEALRDLVVSLTGIDLLWENASVNSVFAAQKITLDLSGYKGIFVDFSATTDNSSFIGSGFIPMTNLPYFQHYVTGAGTIHRRTVRATSSSVVFGEGTSSESNSISNSMMIPVRIYGMK